jgi:hypothetical protein
MSDWPKNSVTLASRLVHAVVEMIKLGDDLAGDRLLGSYRS